MSLYPTLTEAEFVNINLGIEQAVLKSNFEERGKIQVKRKWLYPRRAVSLSYGSVTNAEIRTLEQFWINRNGEYSIFTFIMPDTEISDYEGEYISTADGVIDFFNIPTKAATGVVIYGDGGEYTQVADATSAGDYILTESGGTDGVDLIEFIDIPPVGTILTADFTGPLAIRCRFAGPIQYSRTRASISVNDISVNLSGTLMDE